jgi:hypothetical protein
MAYEHSTIIVRYKTPFVRWANSRIADGVERTSEYFEENRTALVIKKCETVKEALDYLDSIWGRIFEQILADWNDLDILWPQNRTKEMFHQWLWELKNLRTALLEGDR